jgi:integrase
MKERIAMTRRGNGDGSVYRRQSDGKWVAYLRVNGKKKYIYDDTQTGVTKKLRAAQRDLEQGELATGPNQTVKQYLEYWLEVRRSTVKASTYVSNRSYLNNRVIPVIGHIKLQKLTGDHIQSLYAQLLKDGLLPNTIRLIHTMLFTASKDAVKWKRMSRNPCKDATPPRQEDHTMAFLTHEQAKNLMEAASATPLECLITLAITTGMRRGEILALRWSDIDWQKMTVTVRHTVSYIRVGDKHAFFETEPKTASSNRTISLPQFVIHALKSHRSNQLQVRLKAGDQWNEKNIVFSTKRGDFYNIATLQRQFGNLLVKAGLPHMRFHDLRHSAATILLSMGVNIKVIQELLGHSNVGITLRVYSHVLPTMHREAMEGLQTLYAQEK